VKHSALISALILVSIGTLGINSAWATIRIRDDPGGRIDKYLEPISKSSEEDNEASELDESEEVLGVILPADEDAALPLDPRKEAFDQPTTHVAA
jgi:hypothetical protein